MAAAEKFQSTRPQGARHANISSDPMLRWFQSTRPQGARPSQIAKKEATLAVSIHAPAGGATQGW